MTPREPNIPRTIRATDSLWNAALKRADERGESLSEAVRRFLVRYSKEKR